MYTLGIDLHKRMSSWTLIDDTHRELWSSSVVSHPDHINKALAKIPVPLTEIRVALEPVAGWRWVVSLLQECGLDVHIAHPRKTRLIAESAQKTDAADALTLARLLASGYFPEARRVSDEIYDLRLLLRTRTHIVRMRTSALNRLHGIATTQGLHTIVGGNPRTVKGKVAIMTGSQVILQEVHVLIETLTMRIEVLDAQCAKRARALPLAQLLMTMPSVGVITALTVIAEVADFSQFPSAKKLVGYAGLAPRQRSSGGRIRMGGITHEGSRILRSTLVETAMRIHPKGAPELYAVVARLAPVCGAKKARVALARKLLTILWKMGTAQIPYTPTHISSPCPTTLSKPDTGSGA